MQFFRDTFVDSDIDGELLFNIPFTGAVKLKGLIVIGGEEELQPSAVRLYKDRPDVSKRDDISLQESHFDIPYF